MRPEEKKSEHTQKPYSFRETEAESTLVSRSARIELQAVPTISDRWEITEFLGEGGMSVVYKASHKVMGKFAAIKLLHKHLVYQGTNLQRFQQESIAAGNIDHENVIKVLDCGITDDEQPFLIMEFVPGKSLAQVIAAHGKLSADRAYTIFKQICSGMNAAHCNGVVHRDLKPSNVMLVDHKSKTDFVKIVDFGIAKLLPQEDDGQSKHQLTQTGEVFGSPLYMSPEQCAGSKPDERSDIYSLGCLMYEVLAGKPPLMGASYVETMFMQMNDTPESFAKPSFLGSLSQRLEQVIFKAIAKDPADRYQSMRELEAELEIAKVGSLPWLLKGKALRDLPRIWGKTHRKKIAAVQALLLVVSSISVLAGAGSAYVAYNNISLSQIKNAIVSNLEWWPVTPQMLADDPKLRGDEKLADAIENEYRKKFADSKIAGGESVGADFDYIDALVKHAQLLVLAGDYQKALDKLDIAQGDPMKSLKVSDPKQAKVYQADMELQQAICATALDQGSKEKAQTFCELIDSNIQQNGRKSPFFKLWANAAGRTADMLRNSTEHPIPDFLQTLAHHSESKAHLKQTQSTTARQEARAAKRRLRGVAPDFISARRLYDQILELNTQKVSDQDMQGDPEVTAKCLRGLALLDIKYGITAKTIKEYGFADESPESLFEKALQAARLIPPPRGKAIFEAIGMDYVNYRERESNLWEPWTLLETSKLRQNLINEFNK